MTQILRTTLAASVFGATLVALPAPMAEAATFTFSYAADEGLLRGRLTGTLGAHGNTVVVSAITALSFGGVAMGPMTLLDAGSGLFAEPTVTLNGTSMSIYSQGDDFVPPPPFVGGGPRDILLLRNDVVFQQVTVEIDLSTKLDQFAFDADLWSVTQVPLPASLGLLIAAVAGLTVLRRRRA